MTKAEAIAAANDLIAAARASLIEALDVGLAEYQTAVRALVAAEDLPEDVTAPPAPTYQTIINDTGENITLQLLDAGNGLFGPSIFVPNHSITQMPTGAAFSASSILGDAELSVLGPSTILWEGGIGPLVIVPTDLTLSGDYTDPVVDAEILQINGSYIDTPSGVLADATALAAWLADFLDLPASDIGGTTLEVSNSTSSNPIVVYYQMPDGGEFAYFSLTLNPIWETA